MLNEEVVIEIYEWYQNIENKLLEIIEVIPFSNEEDLKKVHSPRLVPIVVETCSLIDTLYRYLMPENFKRPGPNGRVITKAGANIYDYYREIEARLTLKSTKTLLLYGKPVLLCPYEKWSEDSNSPMPWWKVYNRLKHDRIKSSKEASLYHCVSSLCALQQLMTKIPNVMELSLRYNWVQTAAFNPTLTISDVISINDSKYVAYTKLFATFLKPVDWKTTDDIRPSSFRNNDKLIGHLGRLVSKSEL